MEPEEAEQQIAKLVRQLHPQKARHYDMGQWLNWLLDRNPPPWKPKAGDIVVIPDGTEHIVVGRSMSRPLLWVLESTHGELKKYNLGSFKLRDEDRE